ncbi:MAG: hypothetical protein AAFX44_07220 [Pseudomonadota bacterium]
MSLEDLGNIGEMIGGFAVIISLIYLATQIRQSSRIARFQAHRSLSEAMSSIMGDIASDPEMYRVWNQMINHPDEASDEDRERFGMMLYRAFSIFGDAERFADLDDGLRRRYELYRDRLLGYPAVRRWWSRQRITYSDPFRSVVDQHIAANYSADVAAPETATGELRTAD